MKMRRTMFAYPYVVWMLIFILAPVLMIAYYAFTSDGTFTLENLTGALTNEMYMQVLLRSIWIALKATVICLVLGYPIAYLLSKMKKGTALILQFSAYTKKKQSNNQKNIKTLTFIL